MDGRLLVPVYEVETTALHATLASPFSARPPASTAPACSSDDSPGAPISMEKPPPFLACPECRSRDLRPATDLRPLPRPFESSVGLRCGSCGREYPNVDGVWVMWSDQVRRLQTESELGGKAGVSDRVKRANIAVYQAISEDYGEHNDGSRPYAETVLFLRALASEYRSPAESPREPVLVDVACANGLSLRTGTTGYKWVVGLDISLENLKAVRGQGFTAVMGDAEHLPFAADSIDLITCFAALHHLPDPGSFVTSSHECLRRGGVLLVGAEPSRAQMGHRLLGRAVWELRRPVYRALARYSGRFYLHQDRERQRLNDLAEHGRTHGGIAPHELEGLANDAGFGDVRVFYDIDISNSTSVRLPGWKMLVLKSLSLQNPLSPANSASLSALARKV